MVPPGKPPRHGGVRRGTNEEKPPGAQKKNRPPPRPGRFRTKGQEAGGRRDFYYAPERIPPEYRHAYSFDAGAVPGQAALVEGRGFRGMGQFAFAEVSGGARNGVMTAVDDFLADALRGGRELGFAEIPAVFGLGVIFDLDAPWSAPLADLLLPYHQNKLIGALEANRLRNYLRVLDLQDEAAARTGSV